MKIIFNEKFRNEITQLGNSVKLNMFRIAKVNNSDEIGQNIIERLELNDIVSDYYNFDSLWYEEAKSLNITFSIAPLVEYDKTIRQKNNRGIIINEGVTHKNIVLIYYSDLSDRVIDWAFVLWNESGNMNLCKDKLNHITVYFPKETIANIETQITGKTVKYLEENSGTIGVNAFLVAEDSSLFDEAELITKDSYYRYARAVISGNNETPLYLDSNGEKVFSISYYKHYKKIDIKSISHVGDESKDKFIYYVGAGDVVYIGGTVTYDLYKVSNSLYTLVESDCVSDISETTLVQVGNITNNYTINNGNKTISFEDANETERTDFACELTFRAEIGEEKGNQVTIQSNIVEFVTYLNWTVNVGTNYSQDGFYLFLFDTAEGSSGFTRNSTGTITMTSDSKIDNVVDQIRIVSENQSIFDEYFSITKKFNEWPSSEIRNGEPGDIITEGTKKRYRYNISIKTKKSSEGSEKWFPLVGGTSTLILNTLKIEGSSDEFQFYCVQRCKVPIELKKYDSETSTWSPIREIVFSGTLGLKDDKFYATKQINGYNKWIVNKNLTNVETYSLTDDIVKADGEPHESTSITAYTRMSPGSEKINLGKMTFKRVNDSGNVDSNSWLDQIYCADDNDAELNFFIDKDKNISDNWLVNSNTPYFYNKSISEIYRLYLFDWDDSEKEEKTQSFTINTTYTTEIEKESNDINEFFEISQEKLENENKVIVTIKAKKKNDNSDLKWMPIISEVSKLIKVTIKNTEETKKEDFYCVIKPNLEETIKFYEPVNIKYKAWEEIEDGEVDENTPVFASMDEFSLVDVNTYEIDSIVKVITGEETSKLYKVIQLTKNYSEIESTTFNETKKCTVYIGSEKSVEGFNKWRIYSKDTEYEVTNNISSSTDSPYNLNIGNPENWNKPNFTILETNITLRNRDDLEDLVICRSSRTVSNIEDLLKEYNNWLSQVYEGSKASLRVLMEGANEEEKISVFTYEENTTTQLHDGDSLNLSYVGLYKLFVKYEGSTRIILNDSTGEYSDNFYFYDSHTDQTLYNVRGQDDTSGNSALLGKEVCFSFIGHEVGCFVENQDLRTKIEIFDPLDRAGTLITIKLHRDYFNNNIPVLNSTIDRVYSSGEDKSGRIFIKSNEQDASVTFLSTIETDTTFTGDERVNLNGDNIKLSYKSFSFKKGYKETKSIVEANIDTTDFTYPLSVLGRLNIKHPESFDNERITVDLYKLIPAPTIEVNNEFPRLSSRANSSVLILISNPTGEVVPDFDISYKVAAGRTNLDFKFERVISQDQGNNIAYMLTETTGETLIDDTVILGYITLTTYVHKDRFILDYEGNSISPYTQDKVNELVGYTMKTITVTRLSQSDDTSFILGDMSTLVPKEGQTNRKFELALTDTDSGKTVNTSVSGQNNVSRITHSDGSLSVNFKSKLDRHGYYNGINVYGYSGSNSINTIVSNYSAETLEGDDFYVTVGDNKIYTNGIQQERWEYGIIINKILYLGENNSIYLESYDESGGEEYLDISAVKLPRVPEGTIEIINDESIYLNDYSFSYYKYESNGYISNTIGGSNQYIFTAPDNSDGTYEWSATYTVEDGRGNKVYIYYTVPAKDSFSCDLYNSFDSNTNQLSEKLDDLIFSASGHQRYNDTCFLKTDANTSRCSASDIYITTNIDPNYLTNLYSTYKGSGYEMEERCSSCEYKTSIEENGKTYYIYEVKFFSRLSWIKLKVTSGSPRSEAGHTTFTGRTGIRIGYNGSYTYYDSYYGSAHVEVLGPMKVYQSFVSDNDIRYYIDWYTEAETSYYSSYGRGSYYMMNDNIGQTGKVEYNNKIILRCADYYNDNTFQTYGFHTAFKLYSRREEWCRGAYEEGSIESFVSENESFSGGELKLFDIQDNSSEYTIISKDGNQSTETLADYYDSYQNIWLDSGDEEFCHNGTVTTEADRCGIAFNYAASNFSKNSKVYTETETLTERGGGQDWWFFTDEITFEIEITVITT